MKYLRYTMAAVCGAASVGCLALWWRSTLYDVTIQFVSARTWLTAHACNGCTLVCVPLHSPGERGFSCISTLQSPIFVNVVEDSLIRGRFGVSGEFVYFPLWYPALVFALAGVGILRIGRFTIRSALIVTAIVAALLAMVVVL